MPAAATTPGPKIRPPGQHSERAGKKRSKKKRSHPTLPPIPPLEALPADPVAAGPPDVELVAMTPPVAYAAPVPVSRGLSRRDLFSFTVGVGSGALAAIAGRRARDHG